MKNFLISKPVATAIVFFCQATVGLQAAEPLGTSQEVLATMGEVKITQGELDGALSRIPEQQRLMFVRDGNRMEQLVRNLLMSRALAHEAAEAGYDQDTMVSHRLELGRESALAQEWLNKIEADAPAVDYEALAEEQYLLSPESWKTKDRVDVSHILISTDTRSEEQAKDLVGLLWQRLQADPALFEDLVEEYSEDESKRVNGGRFPDVERGQMVPNFERVAFAMTMPGEISGPTETPYGFHIIRLNERMPGEIPPFESIREEAVEKARETYRNEYREKYLRDILSEQIVLQDGAADKVARRYFGENLELAPDYENFDAGPAADVDEDDDDDDDDG